ncbi:MAG: T9SS type A sorting domain-containing protein [Elusimicrobia bacterium]|nr:T9SS type A sorting domain-containing protein [Elusimicrobiota bacterium]
MKLALWVWLAWAPAAAQVSSGGAFSLDRTSAGPGGKVSGGDYEGCGVVEGNAASTTPDPLLLSGGGFELRVGLTNPPPFTLSSSTSAVVPLAGGTVTMAVSSGTVPLQDFDLVARQDPLNFPVTVDPSAILEANRGLAINDPLSVVQLQNTFEFKVIGEQGYYDGQFAAPIVVSFGYTDNDNDGVLDGTNPPLRARLLNVWTLDEEKRHWVEVQGAVVDTANKVVTVPVRHFSVYAFAAASNQDVDGVYAYPVPFRPFGPEAGPGAGQTGTEAGGITFTNLPSEGAIEIYTLTGQLVRRLEIPPSLALPRLIWDVRNLAGQSVVSGVYIWKVASRTAFKTGRLMVIR